MLITLNKSSAVESVPFKGKYKFTVKCGETEIVYELEAKDQKSRLEWIASIQAAIGRFILLTFCEQNNMRGDGI